MALENHQGGRKSSGARTQRCPKRLRSSSFDAWLSLGKQATNDGLSQLKQIPDFLGYSTRFQMDQAGI